MNTPTKLAGFAVIVVLTFGGGYGAGQLYGPEGGSEPATEPSHPESSHPESSHAEPSHPVTPHTTGDHGNGHSVEHGTDHQAAR